MSFSTSFFGGFGPLLRQIYILVFFGPSTQQAIFSGFPFHRIPPALSLTYLRIGLEIIWDCLIWVATRSRASCHVTGFYAISFFCFLFFRRGLSSMGVCVAPTNARSDRQDWNQTWGKRRPRKTCYLIRHCMGYFVLWI